MFQNFETVILKKGLPLISTGYWPMKIINETFTNFNNKKRSPHRIFSLEEKGNEISLTAQLYGINLIE
ncbi:hypothetical protein [Candidatus Nitrosocosmicus sp. R]